MPAKRPPLKRRLPPSSADSPPTVEIAPQSFGRRLQQLLDQKGMNYSDLARLVWGKMTTKGGYEVAKNRDRISVYVAGKAFPDARNLKKIADSLNVTVADLAPERVGGAMVEETHPEVSLTSVTGQQDKTYLRVNKLVPMALAVKIAAMLVDNPNSAGEAEPDDDRAPFHDLNKAPKIARLGMLHHDERERERISD